MFVERVPSLSRWLWWPRNLGVDGDGSGWVGALEAIIVLSNDINDGFSFGGSDRREVEVKENDRVFTQR